MRGNMFWRGREKEVKEHNGGLPWGQVRVLVVGDSGEFILMPTLRNLLSAVVLSFCVSIWKIWEVVIDFMS